MAICVDNVLHRLSRQSAGGDMLSTKTNSVLHCTECCRRRMLCRCRYLVERLDNMKRNVLGNGTSQCLLCGEEFGLLGASASECEECSKVERV